MNDTATRSDQILAEAELRDHRVAAQQARSELDYPFDGIPDAAQVLPVADGVFWLRMPLPFALNHINLYLLEDGDGWAIVDTGLNTSMVRDLWRQQFEGPMGGRPVKRIIVTHYHPDHLGCAGWLAGVTGAPIYMTRAEFLLARCLLLDVRDSTPHEALKFYAAAGLSDGKLEELKKRGWGNFAKAVHEVPLGYRRLVDGDVLEIGARRWQIVTGSGHSPEHACLYDADEGLLISGDQVLPRITSNISVYPTEPRANPLAWWIASLRKLKQLREDCLVLPAHNEPFRGLHDRLDALFNSHAQKLAGLAEFCDEPRTVVEVFPALFKRRITGMEFFMALGESIAHTHYLEAKGVLARESDSGAHRFRRVAPFSSELMNEGTEP